MHGKLGTYIPFKKNGQVVCQLSETCIVLCRVSSCIMSLFGETQDITSLSNLLNESAKAQDNQTERSTLPPTTSGTTNVVLGGTKNIQDPLVAKKASTEIWNMDEIPREDAIVDVNDRRVCPRYEFSYKQSVGTEDTILGMSDKTPLSSDCTHLVVKVHVPGAKMKDLDLDVLKNRIKVTSKVYRLFTYLPVDVDESRGNAKFDTAKEVLTVTLPIIHEF